MTLPDDPYLSDFENATERVRERENELLSIEVDYPPLPDDQEERN
jgi:hypothetical protein